MLASQLKPRALTLKVRFKEDYATATDARLVVAARNTN